MKKLLFVVCLTLGGCASMQPHSVARPVIKPHQSKHRPQHHVVRAPIVAPVVAPAPADGPKPAKHHRWLDYLRGFKKDKTNG